MFVGTNAVAWSCGEWYKGVRMPFRSGLKKPFRVKLIGSVPNVRVTVQVVDMHKTVGPAGTSTGPTRMGRARLRAINGTTRYSDPYNTKKWSQVLRKCRLNFGNLKNLIEILYRIYRPVTLQKVTNKDLIKGSLACSMETLHTFSPSQVTTWYCPVIGRPCKLHRGTASF